MACHSHGVEQLPFWPWTQACASHPHTRCTGTWSFDLANGVLVEIRTWGLLGRLTLIQEQRRPQPAGRGGWPLSFWQNVWDRRQVLDGVVLSSYNLPYLSDRAMWTSSIDAKYEKDMSELKLSMKIQVWQSIEFSMNSMKLFFFFEIIDSCLIELRKRNPLRRTTFKLFRTFKWAVPNSHSLHWRGVLQILIKVH